MWGQSERLNTMYLHVIGIQYFHYSCYAKTVHVKTLHKPDLQTPTIQQPNMSD